MSTAVTATVAAIHRLLAAFNGSTCPTTAASRTRRRR